jgi:hypothetical protein
VTACSVVIVEDVTTTGGSAIKAAEARRGAEIVGRHRRSRGRRGEPAAAGLTLTPL